MGRMAEIIAHKYVKTRKPHNCFGCAREFPKGSILNREYVADGGTVFTAYLCPDCEDYLHRKDYEGDEFCYGDLREAIDMRQEDEGK